MGDKKQGELSAEELEQVSGGQIPRDYTESGTTEVIRRDSRGNPTHFQVKYQGGRVGQPYHYVCPNCGRLLHQGTLKRMYCDPCDESWFFIPDGSTRYGFYSG